MWVEDTWEMISGIIFIPEFSEWFTFRISVNFLHHRKEILASLYISENKLCKSYFIKWKNHQAPMIYQDL
jgi:hypothetical protein